MCDNYLVAMTLVYFKKSGLPKENYNRLNPIGLLYFGHGHSVSTNQRLRHKMLVMTLVGFRFNSSKRVIVVNSYVTE